MSQELGSLWLSERGEHVVDLSTAACWLAVLPHVRSVHKVHAITCLEAWQSSTGWPV